MKLVVPVFELVPAVQQYWYEIYTNSAKTFVNIPYSMKFREDSISRFCELQSHVRLTGPSPNTIAKIKFANYVKS